MKFYCQLASLRLLLLSIWLVFVRADVDVWTTLSPVPAIVGGEDATEGQFPYQVSLIRYNMHWCGASIISTTFVLTASHCATNMIDDGYTIVPASEMSVRLGSIHLNSGGIVIPVQDVTVHPQYNFPNYDVTLLLLSEEIEYTDLIQPIPLAWEQPPPGAEIVVSGWGYLSTGGVNPEILQFVHLTTIDDATCESDLNAVYNTTFCVTHDPGEGICQGDSGGPGNYDGTLLGVVSFTPGSCDNSLPDGMASVPVLYDWIVDNSDLWLDGKRKK